MPRPIAAIALLALAAVTHSDPPTPGLGNPGPLAPPRERATFRVPAGFRVELVAAEPAVVDPVAIAFDEDGRLFVAEMRGYPNGGRGTGVVQSGSIKVLEDRDGDGFYETSRTYATGLRFPTSVMPYKGGLLATIAPDIVFFPKEGAPPRVLYTGFDLQNIQQLVNGLQWGLDNWVYAMSGNGGGTVRSPEKPGQPALQLHGRGVRFRPWQPGKIEPTSGGGQFGLAADDGQHWFTATNSEHLKQIVLPDSALRRNPYLAVPAVTINIPDHGAACRVHRISPFEAWRVERTTRRAGSADARRFPSTELVPGGFITSACSPVVDTADLFPAPYRGSVFVCDPANNLIHRDILTGDGPARVAKRGEQDREFFASTDNWCRPVNLTIGPDGALYVVDFYREVIETPLSLPEDIKARLNLQSRGRGRIWRIVPDDFKQPKKPSLSAASSAELVRHLADANPWWRLTAQRLLIERQAKDAAPALRQLARKSPTAVGRIHALWTLDGLGELPNELIEAALTDTDALVREQALRLAGPRLAGAGFHLAAVLARAHDPSKQVRFQAALTLGASDRPEIAAALAGIATHDGADPWIQTAILSSAAHCAPALLRDLVGNRNFVAAPFGPAFVARAAAVVGARADDSELSAALGLLREAPPGADWPAALLAGLGQGLRNSGQRVRLWDNPPPKLKEAVAAARPLFDRAAATAGNPQKPAAERAAALRLLAGGPFAIGESVWQALLTPETSGDLQLAAVRSLAAHDDSKVASMLLVGWRGYSPTVRREVLEALAARPERISALLDAVQRKQVLPSQIEPQRLTQLRNQRNPKLRARARKLLVGTINADRQKVVAAYQSALSLAGDVDRGRQVFRKNCSTCHRLEEFGHLVGPELPAVLGGKSKADLLVSILDPNREVDPRYLGYLVTLQDGRVLTGLIAAETPSSLTLRRAEGVEDVVLRAQIDSVQTTSQSLMPEGLEKQVTPPQMADLLAYLQQYGRASGGRKPPEKKSSGGLRPPLARNSNPMLFRTPSGAVKPVRTADDWAKRRADILARMQEVMGPLPDRSKRVPLDVQVTETFDGPKFIRKKLTYAAEPGDRVPAYLFLPKGGTKKRPAILVLHQTTPNGKAEPAGVAGRPNMHLALELAERGFVVLAPDYPNFGDYHLDVYARGYTSATMKGIWNHSRAVDLLQSLPEVDSERIGVIGHSLGGHNSLFVAAFDERIKCVVSCCGFCSFPRYKGGDLTGWSHAGYMPRIRTIYGRDPAKVPFDFPEVVAALAPRPFLAVAPVGDTNFDVQGVKDCIAAARPVYALLGAADRLAAEHPSGGHDFAPAMRQRAYAWLERWLGKP